MCWLVESERSSHPGVIVNNCLCSITAQTGPASPHCRDQASLSQISYAKTEETKRQVDSSTYDAYIYRVYFHVQGK